MNKSVALLKKADAFQIVVDRRTARTTQQGQLLRSILHESQRPLFDAWVEDRPGTDILAFGRTFRREPSGNQILSSLPMAFVPDVETFGEYLKVYHDTACRDPLQRIALTAFLILVADRAKAGALRAFIGKLQTGGDYAAR